MKSIIVPDDLNQKRLRILSKGYITRKDMLEFLPAGKKKANRIYDSICHQIELEGHTVSDLGLSVDRVLDYLHLDERKIRAYAKEGY